MRVCLVLFSKEGFSGGSLAVKKKVSAAGAVSLHKREGCWVRKSNDMLKLNNVLHASSTFQRQATKGTQKSRLKFVAVFYSISRQAANSGLLPNIIAHLLCRRRSYKRIPSENIFACYRPYLYATKMKSIMSPMKHIVEKTTAKKQKGKVLMIHGWAQNAQVMRIKTKTLTK